MARRPVLWALVVIMLLAVALRVDFLVQYRPALLGYPDTANYILSARLGLLHDPSRVAGYVAFLRLLHLLAHQLLLVTIVQHALGIASGLLLFDAVRRTGAPASVGLIPAAVVMLGGSELLLEHAILTEAVFIFCIDLCLWAIVRAWTGSLWWRRARLGTRCGDDRPQHRTRTTAVPDLVSAAVDAQLAAPGRRGGERRDLSGIRAAGRDGPGLGVATTRGALADLTPADRHRARMSCRTRVIVPTSPPSTPQTGSWGFTTSGDLALYGRVAPFADCKKFTPPAGTANLCIRSAGLPATGPPGVGVQPHLSVRSSPTATRPTRERTVSSSHSLWQRS